jgi:hypothetical protein
MDRFHYIYEENGKRMTIDVELGADAEQIFVDSIRTWLPPHDKEPITAGERERIRENICEALSFMRIGHRFV